MVNQRVNHTCSYVIGTDYSHFYVITLKLLPDALRKSSHCKLAAAIRRQTSDANQSGHGGNIKNVSFPASHHGFENGLISVDEGQKVGFDGIVEGVGGDMSDFTDTGNARVVDQNVDGPKSLDAQIDNLLDFTFFCDIDCE